MSEKRENAHQSLEIACFVWRKRPKLKDIEFTVTERKQRNAANPLIWESENSNFMDTQH